MSDVSEEEEQCIVIDPGSGCWKAGFAGDDAPRSCFSTYTGVPRNDKDAVGYQLSDSYIGDRAEAKRDLLALHYPIERGIVKDWDGVEKLINFTFKDLKQDPSESSVLMAERLLNPMANKEIMTQLMFESLNVKKFFMNSASTLAMFAAGRSAGMIIDVGEGVTTVSTINLVYCAHDAIQRQDFGGRDLTHVLQQQLYKNEGLVFSTNSELEILREIKEENCFTLSSREEDKAISRPSYIPETYTLPDGKSIKTVTNNCWKCAEALYDPLKYTGRNLRGLHQLVYDCFMNLDMIDRNTFYCNMILAGGSTTIPGFEERLEDEMKKLLPAKRILRVVAPPERKYSVWIGGSILGSLPAFQPELMTKQEYEEFGPFLVHRKFR